MPRSKSCKRSCSKKHLVALVEKSLVIGRENLEKTNQDFLKYACDALNCLDNQLYPTQTQEIANAIVIATQNYAQSVQQYDVASQAAIIQLVS
jgi:hypothetical protein